MAEMLIPLVDAKLYYGTAGSVAATELTGVSDVQMNAEIGKASRKTRASRFERGKPTIYVIGLDFTLPWDETDAGFSALWTAFTTAARVGIKCIAKTAGKGVSGDMYVYKFNRSEKSGDEEETAEVSVGPAADGTNVVAFV